MISKDKQRTETSPDGAGDLWVRILALAIILLIMNSWTVYHFGGDLRSFSLTNSPLVLVGIVGFLTKLLKKDQAEGVRAVFSSWLFYVLKTPVLILLALIVVILGSLLSSVTVLSSGAPDRIEVAMAPEGRDIDKSDGKELKGPNDTVRFHAWTYPFGRPFYLEAEGYLRHSFDLVPWVGKKIRITKDLEISPSLLLRVPHEKGNMLARGQIIVTLGGERIAKVTTEDRRGAVLVGHPQPIPPGFVERWQQELSVDRVDAASATLSLLRWQQPKWAVSSRPVPSKNSVRAVCSCSRPDASRHRLFPSLIREIVLKRTAELLSKPEILKPISWPG